MDSQKVVFRFLPLWVGANVIGWGFYSVIMILDFLPRGGMIAFGLILGWAQWLVLNKFFRVDSSLLWVSAITYGALFMLLILLPIENGKGYILLIFGVLIVLGFLQKSVLDYYFNGAFLWVLSSQVAGVLGLISVLSLISLIGGRSIWIWALFGLVYGLITGGVLAFMHTITTSGKN